MKFTVNRTELLAAAQNAERIAPRVSTIEILQCAYLQAEQDTLTVASGNLEIALEQQLPAQIEAEGSVVVKAPLLSGMLRLLDGERVTFPDEKRKARCFVWKRGICHSRHGRGTIPAHGDPVPGSNRACERHSVAYQTNGVCRFRGYDTSHAQMCEPDLRRRRPAGGQHRQLPHRVRQRRPREPREHQFPCSGSFAGKAGRCW